MGIINQGAVPPVSDITLDTFDTRLEAINLCMRAIGSTGVNSIDAGDIDAVDASRQLSIVQQRVQYNDGKGWWFNVEPNWNFKPDTNGEILIPNNTVAVWSDVSRDPRPLPITLRGRRIYDLNNHTFDVRSLTNKAGNLTLVLLQNLPFEHIPISARQAIAYQAVVEFMTFKEFDQAKINEWKQMAVSLTMNLELESSKQRSYNMMTNNPTQAAFGMMAGGSNAMGQFDRRPYNQMFNGRREIDY